MAYGENKKIDGLEELSTINDADVLPVGDQSDSDRAKKITWSNFKGLIKTYYDSVTATLTNKTLDADNNTISNIGDDEIKTGVDAVKISDGSISNTEFGYLNGVTSAIQTQIDAKGEGTVDTSGTPADNDFAKFTDADTIEGRSYSEVRSDLNIEDNADVTDTANVTSAGALMDSECTSLADVKALDQSVISGATPTFTNTNFTEATDKNYVTDAEKIVIGNTSGANTGDQSKDSLGLDTDDSPQFAGVELGHATDTTLARKEAGEMNVEGKQVLTEDNSVTVTNKTLTSPVINNPSGITTNDVTEDTDKNYVTDAQQTVINNTSGSNTGDQDISGKQNILSEGAFVNGDKTKLDGIETSADVTDTANVTSAGALMDSEITNLTQVKAFDTTDYATSLGADDNYVTDAEKTVIGNTSGSNTGDQDLSTLALKSNVLEKDNTDAFTPDADYEPATKKYVDDNAGGTPEGTVVKSTGETGTSKFLRVDGDGTCSWQTPAGGGNVSNTGTPVDNDFAKFTSATTIEGRSYSEVRTDLNVEDGADVTDTANVTSAGALMDSEITNLAQVKAFDETDYATSAQGSTADSALQNIVEDTTPQLGGNLDLQTNKIVGEGGSEGVYVDNNGNLGIGTTEPLAMLNVNGDDANSDHNTLLLETVSNRGWMFISGKFNHATYGDYPLIIDQQSTDNIGDFVIKGHRNTIIENGNVGIGTTEPEKKTHIEFTQAGGTETAGGLLINNLNNAVGDVSGVYFGHHTGGNKAGIGLIKTAGYGVGDLIFSVDATADNANVQMVTDEKMRITSSGNVGIGTTEPEAKTHIYDATNGTFTGMAIDNRKTYGVGTGINEMSRIILSLSESGEIDPLNRVMGFIQAGTESELSSSNGFMALGTRLNGAETEKVRITKTGNVGIGTTEPEFKLQVDGGISGIAQSSDPVNPDANSYVMWQSDGTASGSDGSIMMKITDSGGTTKTVTLVDYSIL